MATPVADLYTALPELKDELDGKSGANAVIAKCN